MKNIIIGFILVVVVVGGGYYILTKIKVPVASEETPTPITVEDNLSKLFAEKYNKDASDVYLTIVKQTDTHILGGVKFGSEAGEGGMFLAVKDGEQWKIVFDGNGSISCASIDPYNFPVDMLSECIDNSGNPVDRVAEACVKSGGKIEITFCCKSANDYPNSCAIGACGCSLENSREIKTCVCADNKCWNGTSCAER